MQSALGRKLVIYLIIAAPLTLWAIVMMQLDTAEGKCLKGGGRWELVERICKH